MDISGSLVTGLEATGDVVGSFATEPEETGEASDGAGTEVEETGDMEGAVPEPGEAGGVVDSGTELESGMDVSSVGDPEVGVQQSTFTASTRSAQASARAPPQKPVVPR